MVNTFLSDDGDDDDDDDDFPPLSPSPTLDTGYLVIKLFLLLCSYLPFQGYLATKTLHLSLSSSLYVSTFSGLPCNQASPAVSVCFLPCFHFVGPILCLSPFCTRCIATKPFHLSVFPESLLSVLTYSSPLDNIVTLVFP